MRDIHIHVEEVVLDGVELSDSGAFRAALADTLTSLAASHQEHYPAGTAYVLRGSSITAPISGEDVAHSVWASMIPQRQS